MNIVGTAVMTGWGRQLGCRAHPQAVATAACARCSAPLCGLCTQYVAYEPACVGCARKRARLRGAVKTVVGLAAALAVATGLFFASKKLDAMAVEGDHAKKVAAAAAARRKVLGPLDELADSLAKEPCDRTKAYNLANELALAGEHRKAILVAETFFPRCGDLRSLHSISVGAHRQLSEWDAAIDETSKMLAKDPTDHDVWFWRAETYEDKGDLEKAAADYRQVLYLRDDFVNVPFYLADVLERLGQPCEAIAPLENVLVHAEHLDVKTVQHRIGRLYADPRCASLASQGQAVIRIPATGMIHANGTLNGTTKVRMLVDTGASAIAMPRKVARKLGIDVDALPTVQMGTAGGVRTAHIAMLDSVTVQGITAHHVRATISDDADLEEVLLGQSFLSRFTMTIDRDGRRMELRGRTQAPRPSS